MERHELRELVEDALEALKPRYQRTRTPFNLQTIREEVEDQHGAPLADDDAAHKLGKVALERDNHPEAAERARCERPGSRTSHGGMT